VCGFKSHLWQNKLWSYLIKKEYSDFKNNTENEFKILREQIILKDTQLDEYRELVKNMNEQLLLMKNGTSNTIAATIDKQLPIFNKLVEIALTIYQNPKK